MPSIRALALPLLCAAALVLASGSGAQTTPAVADGGAVPLYPADKGKDAAAGENWTLVPKQGRSARNVTIPTLTPFLPDPHKATGAAVVVLPGGAFMALSMDHEGYKVARVLADRGIAAFVLKYRLLPTPEGEREAGLEIARRISASLKDPTQRLSNPQATEDALAALKMVRDNAAKWNVDPKRTGVIGFSAGAIASLDSVISAPPAARPAFVGYVYGPQDAVTVPVDAPPLFDAIAMDDPLFPHNGFAVVAAWRMAKRPVELHAYEKGGHGFGTGRAGTTSMRLLDDFVAWMQMHQFIADDKP